MAALSSRMKRSSRGTRRCYRPTPQTQFFWVFKKIILGTGFTSRPKLKILFLSKKPWCQNKVLKEISIDLEFQYLLINSFTSLELMEMVYKPILTNSWVFDFWLNSSRIMHYSVSRTTLLLSVFSTTLFSSATLFPALLYFVSWNFIIFLIFLRWKETSLSVSLSLLLGTLQHQSAQSLLLLSMNFHSRVSPSILQEHKNMNQFNFHHSHLENCCNNFSFISKNWFNITV